MELWSLLATSYLALGGVVLLCMDLWGKGSVRRGLANQSEVLRYSLASLRWFLGARTSYLLLLLSTWLFWPAALSGWVAGRIEGRRKEE